MSKLEAERRILERIYSTDEWPKENQGLDRMALIQAAYDLHLWPWEDNWQMEELQ